MNISLIFYILYIIKCLNCIKSETISNDSNQFLKIFFQNYTKNLNRNFRYEYERLRHLNDFQENFKRIQEHNNLYESGEKTFKLGLNNFADLNNKKYLKNFLRLTSYHSNDDNMENDNEQIQMKSSLFNGNTTLLNEFNLNLPDDIDWRSSGFVTRLDNQRSCGSCYALSVVYSIEGQLFKRTGKIIPLSVQQLIDCSILTGNHGCSGGSLRNTFRYLELHGGIMRDEDYPYTEKQGKCHFIHELALVNVTSWNILPRNDEDALKIAVATFGPIAVSLNAAPLTFQLYKEGIYDDNSCTSNVVNHAMLIVGYTPDYWILKNWWGKEWGENGYIRIKRGKNMCGIARYAAYAII